MPIHRHPIIPAADNDDPLSHVPLDRALIKRLKESYELIRASDVRLAEIFYAKLFAAAPHLRSLFRTEPRLQAEKLMASLDAIVRNLEAPAENAEMLAALGRRHATYGARPEHYTLVIEMLVDSIRELLQERALQQCVNEWRVALRLVGEQMMRAAASAAADEAPTRS